MGNASDSDASADSDDEERDDNEAKIARLDKQMDSLYESYQTRLTNKNPSHKAKKEKNNTEFEEWYGVADDAAKISETRAAGSDSDDSDDEIPVELMTSAEREKDLSSKAKLFFDNPVFQHGVPSSSLFDKEMETETVVEKPSKTDKIAKKSKSKDDSRKTKKRKADAIEAFNDDEEPESTFDVVPLKEESEDDGGTFI
jgi:AdoMet-dependent rRNA methyltransferase SPB1